MRKKSCRCVRISVVLALTAFLSTAFFVPAESKTLPAGSTSVPSSQADAGDRPGNGLADLLGGIAIPSGTAAVFNGIYVRHGRELTSILSDNPVIIWDTLDILLDILPGLRAVPANGGRLFVTRAEYDRAAILLQKFMALSSDGLAEDLEKARTMIDRRLKETGEGKIVIDLN